MPEPGAIDPIAPGGILLHIGPAKTGTTTLQSAFHNNRPELAEHGVHYAGARRHSVQATRDLLTYSPAIDRKPTGRWQALAEEIRTTTADRVVLSSEALAKADEVVIDRLVADVGRDPAQVVITMRPLADMLSSSYWQFVQSGLKMPYDEWLDGILRTDLEGTTVTPSFWRRTRIDVVAARWAQRVGTERVTVVSLADRPRDFVLRVFEEFVGVPEGVLVPRAGKANETLPHPVIEVARVFNEVVRDEGVGSRKVHLARMAAYDMLKLRTELLTDDTRLQTPAWAAQLAGEIAAEINDGVRALGVPVLGDLDALTRPSRPAPEDPGLAPTSIPVRDAAALLYFLMRGTALRTEESLEERFRKREQSLEKQFRKREQALRAELEPRRPEDLGGRELVRLLGGRLRHRVTGKTSS